MRADGGYPRFVDFEASSLSRGSYPIEIAWSDDFGRIESHLIDPSSVLWWREWSDEAEAVHGIGRDDLSTAGRDPAWICERLVSEVRGLTLFSDAASFDEAWLHELFRGAGLMRPDVRVAPIDELAVLAGLDGATRGRLHREARALAGGSHRAGMDVKYLVELYRLAEGVSRG